MQNKRKGFTILELLVVVAIIAILAVIAVPNFIGRIEEAKVSQNLAEINAVEKAIATYYADNGVYPTLQGKDGTLLQSQPLEGSPHNIDFSILVPSYLATLPHFSYWWVDYRGEVYHTEKTVGVVASGVFTPTTGYAYTLYKANGTTQVLSAPYTLQTGEYVLGKDDKGVELPKVNSTFKNEKMHPEDPKYVANRKPVAVITMSPSTGVSTASNITWSHTASTDIDGDALTTVEWQGKQTTYSVGTYTVQLRVQDSTGAWSDWVSVTFTVTTPVITGYGADLTVPSEASSRASASTNYNDRVYSRAFDNASTSYATDAWESTHISGDTSPWLKYDFGSPKRIEKYTLVAGYAESTPRNWVFQGSNDNSSWTTLHTVTNQTGWTVGFSGKREFTFSNLNTYRYYKIVASALNGDGYCIISEMEMMEGVYN